MRLEYFQMIDRVEAVDRAASRLSASALVPLESPVFEGHFPGMPLVPGVLLIETMAQACGLLILALNRFEAMPFLASVDDAKLRAFVGPGASLAIAAEAVHMGSGYAVADASVESDGKRVANARLKLKTMPFSQIPIGDAVRARIAEIGLHAAIEGTNA